MQRSHPAPATEPSDEKLNVRQLDVAVTVPGDDVPEYEPITGLPVLDPLYIVNISKPASVLKDVKSTVRHCPAIDGQIVVVIF